jgi:hypothetical protein
MKRTFLMRAAFCLFLSSLLSAGEWHYLGIYKTTWNQYRLSLFNPDNRCVERMGLRKGPSFDLSQFLGVQVKALSFDWQAEIRGSANLVPGNDGKTDLTIPQLFVQKSIFENIVLIVGRAIQGWGTGYAFNPSDVVAPEKSLSDPDNSERGAVGNDMVLLEYLGSSSSVSLCALTRLDFKSGIRGRGSKLAFRFYQKIRHVDLSFISAFKTGESPVWGLNFAAVFGDRLEIHGEAAAQKGSPDLYHPAADGAMDLYRQNPLAPLRKTDGKYYRQLLLGFMYTFPGDFLWVSEYYHRDQGYSRKEWSRLTDYVSFLNTPSISSLGEAALSNLLWSLQVFSPKGAMRDYWMNHVRIPVSGVWEITLTHLLNCADSSFVMIPEVSARPGRVFTFYLRSTIFQGRGVSEYGSFFQSSSLEAGLRMRI